MSTDTPNRERQGAVKTSEPATNGKPASATSQEETSSRVDGELENDNVVSASPKPAASVEGVGEGLATTDSAQATNGSDSSVTVDKVEDASGTQDGTATSVVETSGSLVDDEMLLLTGPAAVEASREAARA